MLPVASKALDNCVIEDTASETIKSLTKGAIIPTNTTIIQGIVECTQDFKAISHSEHAQQAKENNTRLNLFLMSTLLIAVIAGLWSGLAAYSITTGLNAFCSILNRILPPVCFLQQNRF